MSSQHYATVRTEGATLNRGARQRTASRAPSPSPAPAPAPALLMPPHNYSTIPSKESYEFRDCPQPIEEICLVTNYLANISDDFKRVMLKFICQEQPRGPGVYSEYAAPRHADTVSCINGKGGYFLKLTAIKANIYLIWYNRARGVYMFWGAFEREVHDAMNRLRSRIVNYSSARRITAAHQAAAHQAAAVVPSYEEVSPSPPFPPPSPPQPAV